MEADRPGAAPPRGSRLRTAAVLTVAALSGWFVMVLEILGGRLLTPKFGSTVYVVWGSVIGVFLLSLAGGYLLGGRFSRRPDSQRALGLSLGGAGAWLLLVPFLADPVCNRIFAAGLSDELGSLMAAFALFCVPTVLLGTVCPTAARWLTPRAEQSGSSAGLVLAVSTASSFAGCIVTAFYLVRFSLRRTVWASGTALLILGGLVLLHWVLRGRRRRESG